MRSTFIGNSCVSILAMGLALASAPAVAQEVRGPEAVPPASGAVPATDGAPAAAVAAPEQGQSLGDIVVTARKVAENLQNVPVAVTAFSGASLQQQSARAVADVALLTPSLVIAAGETTPTAPLIMMRGQIQLDTVATLDSSVGIYVDGLYWSRAYGINAALLDIKDVQTLKGPQGTLFGRNTTGGAVLINTNDPSFSEGLSGELSGTYGRFNYGSVTAILNAPLIDDKLAIRLAFQRNTRDGYIRQLGSGNKLDNLDDYTIRGKILFKPAQDFSIVLSGEQFWTKTYMNPFRLQYVGQTGLAALSAVAQADGLGGAAAEGCFNPDGMAASCSARAQALFAPIIAQDRTDTIAATNQVSRAYARTRTVDAVAALETSFGSIKAIGGYRNVRSYNQVDYDGSNFLLLDNLPGFPDVQNLSQYSIEVVAAGKAIHNTLDFAVGALYFHESGTDAGSARVLAAINPVVARYNGDINNDSEGVYGQLSYHVTPKLSLTGGLRYSIDRKGLTAQNGSIIGGVFICDASACGVYRSKTFYGVSYLAGVDYRLDNDILVYAKTARGFRSGGQNLRGIGAIPASVLPFGPEQATSYETGVKSEWFDRHLRLNIAAYYTIDKGIQRSTLYTDAEGDTASTISNAGRADFYGGELEASVILPEGIRIDGTAAYTHPKYVQYADVASGFDRSNEPFYIVPAWTASISPSWSHRFQVGTFTLRGDFAYQSDMPLFPQGFYTDAAGTIRDASTGVAVSAADAEGFTKANTDVAHWLVNARADLVVMDGKLDVAVWGKNLTNQRDLVAGDPLFGLGDATAIRREPRTYGVTATIKFGG